MAWCVAHQHMSSFVKWGNRARNWEAGSVLYETYMISEGGTPCASSSLIQRSIVYVLPQPAEAASFQTRWEENGFLGTSLSQGDVDEDDDIEKVAVN